MKAAAVLSCYLFVAKHMIWQIKLQRDNKRNPRKYRKIPWIFGNEVKPEKAAAKFGKDEVASSNLASSSRKVHPIGWAFLLYGWISGDLIKKEDHYEK